MALGEYIGLSSFFFYLLIIILAIFWYCRTKYSYWTERNVLSLPTLPLLGSYLEVLKLKKHFGLIAQDNYNKYSNEKLVGGFKAFQPELLVRDPEIIRNILVKDFNYFVDHPQPSNDDEIFSLNLFSMKGEKWRYLRHKLTPTFTSLKMKKMFPLIEECGQELRSYLKKASEKNDVLEIKEILAQFTTDTIGSCAFGLKIESMSKEDAYFRRIGRAFFAPSKMRVIFEFLYALIPNVMGYLGFKFFSTLTTEVDIFFGNLIKDLFKSRNNTPSNRNDFIDLMIELKNNGVISGEHNEKLIQDNVHSGQSFEITDKVITAQALVFFIAGFETSSTVMSYALRELALNPGIQDTLAKEIDAVLMKYEGKLTYESIQEMKYLNCIIDESMRKYPPAPALIRNCIAKYQIPNTEVVLDKGVEIFIPVYALHHDPKYFPEPHKFIPERFAPGAEKTHHPFSYLPFGEGPRNCIGSRFARLQVATGLVSILREFSWEACDMTPVNLEFEPACLILTSNKEFWLKMKQRPRILGS